jgi:hypothetical protein
MKDGGWRDVRGMGQENSLVWGWGLIYVNHLFFKFFYLVNSFFFSLHFFSGHMLTCAEHSQDFMNKECPTCSHEVTYIVKRNLS